MSDMENIEDFKSCEKGHSIIYYPKIQRDCPLCAQRRKNEIALEVVNNITKLIRENCPTGCQTLTAIQKIKDEK